MQMEKSEVIRCVYPVQVLCTNLIVVLEKRVNKDLDRGVQHFLSVGHTNNLEMQLGHTKSEGLHDQNVQFSAQNQVKSKKRSSRPQMSKKYTKCEPLL